MISKPADRLARLEAARIAEPLRLLPEEVQEAAQWYEASLYKPEASDPRAVAYWATTSLHQLSADYTAMLNGAPAPWEHATR
jgi:hypothetical protein